MRPVAPGPALALTRSVEGSSSRTAGAMSVNPLYAPPIEPTG